MEIQQTQPPRIPILCPYDEIVEKAYLQELLVKMQTIQRLINSIDEIVNKQIPDLHEHLSEQSTLEYTLLVTSYPKYKANRTEKKQVKKKIDFNETLKQFFIDGQPIPFTYFTELEHNFLSYLYEEAEKVCSYEQIAKHVWNGMVGKNTIAQMVSRLRKKLNQLSPEAGKRHILTCYGYKQGYLLLQNA